MGAHTTVRRTFTKEDVDFLQAVANVLAAAIESKRAEEALVERENLLRTIIETEPECVKLIAADGSLLEMNPAGLAMIEADSLDQVVGKCVYPLVAPEYRQSFKALTERVFQGESGILEFEIVGIKGTRRWLEAQAVPLCNQKDEIIALLGITRDISERKRADEALRESEAQHRMLLEHYLDGVTLIVDEEIVYANPILCEMVGYSAEELFGRPCLELLVPEDRERVAQRIRELFAGALEYPSEYRMLKRDRGILPVEIASRVIQYDGQPALLCILRDITDRKRTEEALQAAREELEGRVERQMLRRNPYGLTFRELTVLNLVAGGKADKEIGFTLYISHLTAQKHVANILKKMGVACRTEAGVRAVREGLLE
jgi:PAS domain S-box-containing protein